MCVSAIGGNFRTGIQFFLLYRNEVSYKGNKAASPQPLYKIILYLEVTQSGKKKQNGY